VAILADPADASSHDAARLLADQLGLPLVTDTHSGDFDFVLATSGGRLELRETAVGGAGPVYADFVRGPVGFRRRSAGSL
jgi:hypothetical protein